MRLKAFRILPVVGVFLLSACVKEEPKTIMSPEAEAAMPADIDISQVRRLSNGCYFVVQEFGAAATTRPLIGPDGKRVCDPVALEEMLSPNRVTVNERAV